MRLLSKSPYTCGSPLQPPIQSIENVIFWLSICLLFSLLCLISQLLQNSKEPVEYVFIRSLNNPSNLLKKNQHVEFCFPCNLKQIQFVVMNSSFFMLSLDNSQYYFFSNVAGGQGEFPVAYLVASSTECITKAFLHI